MTTVALASTVGALTPAWLTEALREQGGIGDALVTSVDVEPIGQGVGILCQLFRLTLEYDGEPEGVPQTVIAKIPALDPQTRGMVSVFRFYEREVRFYLDLGDAVGLNTPRCYYGAYDDASGDFVLLLEDLEAKRLGEQLGGCALDDARLVIRELAGMHAKWWGDPRLDELTWMPRSSDPINKAGLALYPMAWPIFLERFGDKLPDGVRGTGEQIATRFNEILDRFAERPGSLTLCHGDARLDNFFFAAQPGDPPITVIDWQISLKSVGTYDLGYFMTQSLALDVRREHEQDLLRLYYDTLIADGVADYSYDQMLEDYRWTVLFCIAYPVMGGGLGELVNDRAYQLVTAMLERSASAILDWDAGALLE